MLGLLTRARTSAIGLDFGSCSLRAVQLKRTQTGWHIHHWINVEYEPQSPEPPEMDYSKELALAFGPGTFSGRAVSLVLSPPDVEYKLLDVPSALLEKPALELRDALAFELDRQLPWPAAQSEIAAWQAAPSRKASASTMVVSARTASVERWLSVLEPRQCDCRTANIVPNAIVRACGPTADAQGPGDAHCLWGILDLGFRSCRLYLIHDGRLVYARVLAASGKEMTHTLANALHVDFGVAEHYKRVYGIRKTDRGFRAMAGGVGRITEDALPGVLYAVLRETLQQLAGDITRSYRFVLSQFSDVRAGPIRLIGGAARMTGLVDALGEHLAVPVCMPTPTAALTSPAGTSGRQCHPACAPAVFPVLAPAIGAAMEEDAS